MESKRVDGGQRSSNLAGCSCVSYFHVQLHSRAIKCSPTLRSLSISWPTSFQRILEQLSFTMAVQKGGSTKNKATAGKASRTSPRRAAKPLTTSAARKPAASRKGKVGKAAGIFFWALCCNIS